MQFRLAECIFLGYSLKHKGYLCPSSNGKTYIARHVVFDENQFPLKLNPYFLTHRHASHSSSINSYTPAIPTLSSLPNIPCFNRFTPLQNDFASIPESQSLAETLLNQVQDPPAANPAITITVSEQAASDPIPSITGVQEQAHQAPSYTVISSHHIITRGKAGISKPKAYLAKVVTDLSMTEPKSMKSALASPHWKQAMQQEYDALIRTNTWTLTSLPSNREPIGCKWVFRIKRNADGTIKKYKARLVAKGFHQQHGFDFFETFSPVVKPTTVRVVITMALTNNWPIRQIGINNAFLNGDLSEEVFTVQPQGFVQGDGNLVCRLNKALYGHKQAPRAWFHKLHTFLHELGFSSSKCDTSLFIKVLGAITILILVYVDDILITSNSPSSIADLIATLNAKFPLKDLGGLNYFLGIQAHLSSNKVCLTRTKYITDLLHKGNMADAKPMKTPMVTGLKLSALDSPETEDPSLYRSVVGALQYLTVARADIAFAGNKVYQFMHAPKEPH